MIVGQSDYEATVHQYDYKANFAGDLKRHVKSIHKGVRYTCDQCDYEATQKGNLQRHRKSKHQ